MRPESRDHDLLVGPQDVKVAGMVGVVVHELVGAMQVVCQSRLWLVTKRLSVRYLARLWRTACGRVRV
jgi:hypothetical protein